MRKNIILSLLLLGCLATGASAQKKQTLFVPKAGTMVEMLTEAEANQITHLVLQGKINAIDFRHLRDEFTNLQMLDLSNVSISMYAGRNGTYPDKFYVYPANCIPAFAFCSEQKDSLGNVTIKGKETLHHVILSDKIKNIEDAAFKGCTHLEICQIRKKKAPNLMPEALADSITAIFIPKGSGDSYRMKDRWQTFAFIEGEPYSLNVQISQASSLATELTRNGIQPAEVNFLRVEGKLDEADFLTIRDYMPNLVSVDLSQCNATAIPEYTFTQKKYLLNIKLPPKLKTIGQRAFSGCSRLCGTLELPESVTAIEFGAFIGCDNLRYVLARGNKITTLGEQLFGDSPSKLIYKH